MKESATDLFLPYSDLVKLRDLSIARGLDNTAGQVGGDSGSVASGCRGTTPTTTITPTRTTTRIDAAGAGVVAIQQIVVR